MEIPPRKSFTTTRGHEYSFIHQPARAQAQTILFLHGFPSHICDWIHQIRHFPSAGFGIVVPDLLGYGSTSKPSNANEYRLKPMTNDLVELLDHLELSQVVGVGHDFGATLLSRLVAYHTTRLSALVFLAVGPPKLGTPFDVDMVNRMTKEVMGYELLGYIPWLGGDETAQQALERHPEAAMSVMFAASLASWEEFFHPLGKMKQFVEENRRVPVGSWYTEDLRRAHLAAFGKQDGYKGATRWYQMWLENRSAQDEQGFGTYKIDVPALFIVPGEPAASSTQQRQMLAEWTTDLKVVELSAGHWIHLERPVETNQAIEGFLSALNTF